ncbi:hypothetical protein [Chamaesiphon sp.]
MGCLQVAIVSHSPHLSARSSAAIASKKRGDEELSNNEEVEQRFGNTDPR